jgi:putative oxidoreductase
MYIIFMVGRIAFVIIFLVAGALQLVDVSATAQLIEAKVAIPPALMPYAANVQATLGLAPYQLLAVVSSIVEIVFALFILFNVGTRFSAFVLLIFVAAVTYYMHDFWNMAGDARIANLTMAMKNLSMMGGLLILIAVGDWRPDDGAELEEDELAR